MLKTNLFQSLYLEINLKEISSRQSYVKNKQTEQWRTLFQASVTFKFPLETSENVWFCEFSRGFERKRWHKID